MDCDMEIDDLATDGDSEYEEEEYLLYLDIEPTALGESQIRNAQSLKIFGLDTKKPLLQINNQFFQGEYGYSMGTHLFLNKDEEAPVDELYCKCETYYRLAAKTNKTLKMSRVLLKDKMTESKTQEKDITSIIDQLKIERTYEQALNLLLPPGREQPRKIPEDQNYEHLLTSFTTPKVEPDGSMEAQENEDDETLTDNPTM